MQYPSQLIDGKEFGKPGQPGNPWTQPVDHDGKWHNDIVLGFEEYSDGCESARVYRHIPREFLIDWLRIYAPYKPPASR